MHPHHRKGSAAEYMAAAYFSSQGWELFWTPTGTSPCDFVMVKGEETKRVQVKAAGVWTKSGSTYTRVRLGGNNTYKPGDFDILAVVEGPSRMWIIPFEELPGKATLYLEKVGGAFERDYGWGKYEVSLES
ncbi:MAG: hypothetical protein Unbinned7358contig1001_29 [Prokaryotic dsDNA virus sp.]|nr:MAG: hypothetical protein Unbinned7358contig1001_29 [Prokaryotic dsDNA virus sp.]